MDIHVRHMAMKHCLGLDDRRSVVMLLPTFSGEGSAMLVQNAATATATATALQFWPADVFLLLSFLFLLPTLFFLSGKLRTAILAGIGHLSDRGVAFDPLPT